MRSLPPNVDDIAQADFILAVIQRERARPAADQEYLIRSIMHFERARAAFLRTQQNRKVRTLVNDQGPFHFGKAGFNLRAFQDVMDLASKRHSPGYRQDGGKPCDSHNAYRITER